MNCRAGISTSGNNAMGSSVTNSSPIVQLKRQRNTIGSEDDTGILGPIRIRKTNRQEENFRHILQSDTPYESDRKDEAFVFNFYEKVEEAFIAAKRPDEFKKFNNLLQRFNPKTHKIADLFCEIEKLLVPVNIGLAEVFLSFLLPAEAAQVGKFFEHFMVTNAATFVNKLNTYFNKQPAQLRKIYACLNELADDPGVSMKQVEARILPLLKGNQFLIDWFIQQFPCVKPPERLMPTSETVNIHEVQSNQFCEFYENMTELLDSPIMDHQSNGCQLKYINGRIFYGSKMMLPAKLCFLANRLTSPLGSNITSLSTCVHGIRVNDEKLLIAESETGITPIERQFNTNDILNENDVSHSLAIDTTCDEGNSNFSSKICNDITHRMHAIRLNSSYYGNFNCTSHIVTASQSQYINLKKTFNFCDSEMFRVSPRKNLMHSPLSGNISLGITTHNTMPSSFCNAATTVNATTSIPLMHDKRKSPTKKGRSPISGINRQLRLNESQIATNNPSNAIICAKRLRTLLENEPIHYSKIKLKTTTQSMNEPSNNKTQNDIIEHHTDASNFSSINMDPNISDKDEISMQPTNIIPLSSSPHELDLGRYPAINTSCSQNFTTPKNRNENNTNLVAAWTRNEDKIILTEMKVGATSRENLLERIGMKLPFRSLTEITIRHQFLMDFLSKLQGKI